MKQMLFAMMMVATGCVETSSTSSEIETVCTDDTCAECEAGFYEYEAGADAPAPTPTPVTATAVAEKAAPGHGGLAAPTGGYVEAGEEVVVEILADGSARILKNGRVVSVIAKAAVRVGAKAGQWMLGTAGAAAVREATAGAGKVVIKVARCFGPIGALLLLGELSYAGMEIALGPAANEMGVRQKDCEDRFAKHLAGISCLRQQKTTATCADAVAACPDAFFGANLTSSCATESAFQGVLDALVSTIERTSVLGGGSGYLGDKEQDIADAIKSGTFATDATAVCRMRDQTTSCQMVPGALWPTPAYAEAKACWDNAPRDAFYWRWNRATDCCTTDACKQVLLPMKNC